MIQAVFVVWQDLPKAIEMHFTATCPGYAGFPKALDRVPVYPAPPLDQLRRHQGRGELCTRCWPTEALVYLALVG